MPGSFGGGEVETYAKDKDVPEHRYAGRRGIGTFLEVISSEA